MIDVEDWAEIRRLHRAERMSIRAISLRLGIARNTVRAALRSSTAPKYERAATGSVVNAVDGEVRALLAEFPSMPATVISERIGWTRGMTILQERVRELRPLFLPPDPAQRTTYRPGELAQWDLWQPDVEIPVGFGQSFRGWVVNGVSGFSRSHAGWMVPTRAAHDVLGGMLRVLATFGAVPRMWVWDQEGCIGQWRLGRQRLSDEFQAFRGVFGVAVKLCAAQTRKPRDWLSAPTTTTRRASCLGAASMMSPTPTPSSHTWLRRASMRIHATTKQRPAEAIFEDRGSMLAFPPVLPDPTWRFGVRLPRDHFVRVDTNDYSVNPRFVGRRVEVRVSLDEVIVSCDGTEVARHSRFLGRHQTLLAPEHLRVLRTMRAEAALATAPALDTLVEERDLTVYDRIREVG
jgi:transposase